MSGNVTQRRLTGGEVLVMAVVKVKTKDWFNQSKPLNQLWNQICPCKYRCSEKSQ